MMHRCFVELPVLLVASTHTPPPHPLRLSPHYVYDSDKMLNFEIRVIVCGFTAFHSVQITIAKLVGDSIKVDYQEN